MKWPKRKKYQDGGELKPLNPLPLPANVMKVPTLDDVFQAPPPVNLSGGQTTAGLRFRNTMSDIGKGIGTVADTIGGDTFSRSLGDIAGLFNFGLNQREINNLPITQPFTGVEPVMEDLTRRDAAQVNEIRRQARAASLGTTSGSAQREGNIRAAASAQAISGINQAKTAENLRLDNVRARNAQRGQQSGIINAGIFNQQMGDINQNLFTQSQAGVQNRQALVDTILGNKFQRANQDLEREKMALIAMRDNDRGTLRRIYTQMVGDPNVSDTLKAQMEAYLAA